MKILVLGKNGQVGSAFAGLLNITCMGRDEFDLAKPDFSKLGTPDVIINAAAYTAVDKAESEVELCNQINHIAVAGLAEYCANNKIKLVHYSTDYVFDGSGDQPFSEENTANLQPLNIYGASKLAGERAIIANMMSSGADYLILRTSWVYSAYGNNFVKTILRLSSERDVLTVVDDQIGSPTYAPDIAENTLKLIKTGVSGIFHFVPEQQMSWFEFAKLILQEAEKTHVKVQPIKTADYKFVAKRPLNSRLSVLKLAAQNISFPSISHSLDDFFKIWTSAT